MRRGNGVPVGFSMTYRARANFASQHLLAAKYFQSEVAALEAAALAAQGAPPVQYGHQWFAAVCFAVMSMEANVYDILTAEQRGENTPLKGAAITHSTHKLPLLKRYDFVHKHILNRAIELGHGVGQDACLLVDLRDEIVHYKTEWRDDAAVSERLQSGLQRRFKPRPFPAGSVFFPEQCVSADSARWAMTTAEQFMRRFAADTGTALNI